MKHSVAASAAIIKANCLPSSMQYHSISIYPEPYEHRDGALEDTESPRKLTPSPSLAALFSLNVFGLNPQFWRTPTSEHSAAPDSVV